MSSQAFEAIRKLIRNLNFMVIGSAAADKYLELLANAKTEEDTTQGRSTGLQGATASMEWLYDLLVGSFEGMDVRGFSRNGGTLMFSVAPEDKIIEDGKLDLQNGQVRELRVFINRFEEMSGFTVSASTPMERSGWDIQFQAIIAYRGEDRKFYFDDTDVIQVFLGDEGNVYLRPMKASGSMTFAMGKIYDITPKNDKENHASKLGSFIRNLFRLV